MVTDFMLPPLVLQPVVENAVKHGTIRTSRTGEPGADRTTLITIATHKRDGDIYIEVTDRVAAGDGTVAAITTAVADSAPLSTASDIANHSKHKSVGLDNVRTRLAIQCGGTLAIGSSEDGTKVTIVLPESDKERPDL
jgi:LytS/YehU family sensor histidine kinase